MGVKLCVESEHCHTDQYDVYIQIKLNALFQCRASVMHTALKLFAKRAQARQITVQGCYLHYHQLQFIDIAPINNG